MIVLLDTSVLSLSLRRHSPPDHPARARLTALLGSENHEVAIPGVVLQELLSGLRRADDFERLKRTLAPVPLLEPTRADYEEAAALVNHCRSRGVQATAIDALIATLAIRRCLPLFTSDRDFEAMARHSELKLF